MKVLVTGHFGYLGSRLVPLLQQRGHTVHGLDSYLFEPCSFGDPGGAQFSLHEFRTDVRDIGRLSLEGFDAVVHLAGLSNQSLGDVNPMATFAINHHATVQLARRARSGGVRRFVQLSTQDIYCKTSSGQIDEASGVDPATPFALSKWRADEDLLELADGCFSPTILRPAQLYGASRRLRTDLPINRWVADAWLDGRIHDSAKTSGAIALPSLHVADCSRAIRAVLEAPTALVHGEVFVIDGPEVGLTQAQIWWAIDGIVSGVGRRAEPGLTAGNWIRERIGFAPSCSLSTGISELLDVFGRATRLRSDWIAVRGDRTRHLRSLQVSGQVDSSLYRLDQSSLAPSGSARRNSAP